MNDLHAIVYVSSAVHLPTPAELERLLLRARQRNLDAEVTGLLLHHDGNFMQYIEGPKAALLEIYAIILADPLHHQITELLNEPVAAREFTNWAMAFSATTADSFLGLSKAHWRSGDLRDRTIVTPGRELLRQVWRHLPARSAP